MVTSCREAARARPSSRTGSRASPARSGSGPQGWTLVGRGAVGRGHARDPEPAPPRGRRGAWPSRRWRSWRLSAGRSPDRRVRAAPSGDGAARVRGPAGDPAGHGGRRGGRVDGQLQPDADLASRKAPRVRGREPARRGRGPRGDRGPLDGRDPSPASSAAWSAGSGRTSASWSSRTRRGWRPGPRWGFMGWRSRAVGSGGARGWPGAVMSDAGGADRPGRGGRLPDRGAVPEGRRRPLHRRLPPPGRRRPDRASSRSGIARPIPSPRTRSAASRRSCAGRRRPSSARRRSTRCSAAPRVSRRRSPSRWRRSRRPRSIRRRPSARRRRRGSRRGRWSSR